MSSDWFWYCETCEVIGPDLHRAAGGICLRPEHEQFLIDHDFHELRLLSCGHELFRKETSNER